MDVTRKQLNSIKVIHAQLIESVINNYYCTKTIIFYYSLNYIFFYQNPMLPIPINLKYVLSGLIKIVCYLVYHALFFFS